jgi:HEAT repeat protein
VEIRKQAVEGIGRGDSSQAMSSLESIYDPKKSPDLKLRIIEEASRNANSDVAVAFLFKVAESEPDYNVRQVAVSNLARMAGDRSLLAQGATGNSNDDETQLQIQAISAILQRPATEAVPFLIEIAKTNPKPLVRERAIRSLASIQDPRVLKFFREILEK